MRARVLIRVESHKCEQAANALLERTFQRAPVLRTAAATAFSRRAHVRRSLSSSSGAHAANKQWISSATSSPPADGRQRALRADARARALMRRGGDDGGKLSSSASATAKDDDERAHIRAMFGRRSACAPVERRNSQIVGVGSGVHNARSLGESSDTMRAKQRRA